MTGCCDRGLRIWKQGFVREGSEDDDVYEAYAARVEAERGPASTSAPRDPSAGLRYDAEWVDSNRCAARGRRGVPAAEDASTWGDSARVPADVAASAARVARAAAAAPRRLREGRRASQNEVAASAVPRARHDGRARRTQPVRGQDGPRRRHHRLRLLARQAARRLVLQRREHQALGGRHGKAAARLSSHGAAVVAVAFHRSGDLVLSRRGTRRCGSGAARRATAPPCTKATPTSCSTAASPPTATTRSRRRATRRSRCGKSACLPGASTRSPPTGIRTTSTAARAAPTAPCS